MVPLFLVNFYHFLEWYHFSADIMHLTEMVPFWWKFSSFFGMVPFLFLIFRHSSGMVLFLSGRGHFHHSLKWYHYYRGFSALLEWYHYCRGFPALSWNGTILASDFLYISLMVPFFVAEFSHIPYLLQNFHTLLK